MLVIPGFRNATKGTLLRNQQMPATFRGIVTLKKGLCGPTGAGMSMEKPRVKGVSFS